MYMHCLTAEGEHLMVWWCNPSSAKLATNRHNVFLFTGRGGVSTLKQKATKRLCCTASYEHLKVLEIAAGNLIQFGDIQLSVITTKLCTSLCFSGVFTCGWEDKKWVAPFLENLSASMFLTRYVSCHNSLASNTSADELVVPYTTLYLSRCNFFIIWITEDC